MPNTASLIMVGFPHQFVHGVMIQDAAYLCDLSVSLQTIFLIKQCFSGRNKIRLNFRISNYSFTVCA